MFMNQTKINYIQESKFTLTISDLIYSSFDTTCMYISFILKLIFPNVWFKVFSVWAFRAYWIRCWWTTNITRQSSWNQLPALAPHFSLLWIQLLRSGSDFLTGFLFYKWETVIWFPVSPFSLFNLLSPAFLL